MRLLYNYLKSIGFPIIGALFLYLLDPFNLGFVFGYLIVILILLKIDFLRKHLDRDFFFVTLFSVSYALFYIFNLESGIQYIFIYAFFPGFFYLLGKYFVSKSKTSKTLFFIMFFIGFVFSISAIMSIIINLNQGGFAQIDRTIPMFWNGRPMKATLMAGYIAFNMSIPSLLLINRQKLNNLFIICALGIFIASIFSVFRLGSRTLLVIVGINIVIALIYVIPRQTYKENFRLLFFIAALIFLLYNFVPFDPNAAYLSTLGSRLQESGNAASAGGRSELWVQSFINIFEYPLGWADQQNYRFAHNMWLDVARIAGIIPFVLLLIFTVRSLRKIWKAINLHPSDHLFNTIVVVYTLSTFLIFFVEPVMVGLFHLFVVFCLFQGILNAYLIYFKKIKE